MPPPSSTPTKEKKPTVCHAATPTPSLRRVPVKPLGEHNRSRSHSPALGSLSANPKRTPARAPLQQPKPGIDLTRRFADSVTATATSRGASPRGSPSLDRIQEGCTSMARERKGVSALKSRLRGGEDATPPVKKAITFATKEKKLPARRKDLSEHFVLDDAPVLKPFPIHVTKDASLLESSHLFSDLPMSKSKKVVDAKVALPSRVGSRSFGARSLAEDAPHRLAFDAIEMSPQRAPSSPELSPLPCISPEVCNRGSVTWELHEDAVAQEWFRSRDMVCYESFSKTPEAQPSKSPELTRRAMEGANQQTPSPQPTRSPEFLKRGSVPPSAGACFGAGPIMGPEGMRSVKDRRKCKPRGILTIEGELLFSSGSAEILEEEVKETISTPALASVEWMVAEGFEVNAPESSPKMASPGSFSHLNDLEEDASAAPGHRRCRSAVESGSEQIFWKKGLLYEWNLSLSDQKRADLCPSPSEEPIPSPSVEEVSSVGKLRDFSPEGASRSSDIMGSSLVIGALGSLTNTPSSCRGASDFVGEDEVESKYVSSPPIREEDEVLQALRELSLDGQAPHLSMSFSLDSSPESGQSWRGIRTSQSTAWGDSQAEDSQSTAWGDSQAEDSQGEWGEFIRNNRYKAFNSQFRFHSSREEFITPAAKVSPSGIYSDKGDSVVCTPNSNSEIGKKFGTGVEMEKDLDPVSRDESPDLVGISISVSDAPSLDSSSDDFEVLRYHHSQVHPTLVEEEARAPRGRVLLHEADYSPSSLLKADAFRASASIQPRGC